jgi:hypothetical protein
MWSAPFKRRRIGDVRMFDLDTECPVCSTPVTDWSCCCPKCRYHPDSYNRAQDDVALIARFRPWDDAPPPGGAPKGWWRVFSSWLGGTQAGAP